MAFLQFPLVRLGLAFLLGIFLNYKLALPNEPLLGSFCLLLVIGLLTHFLSLKRKQKAVVFGLCIYFASLVFGGCAIALKEADLESKYQALISTNRESAGVQLRIAKLINETDYYVKYRADAVLSGRNQTAAFLLRIAKDSLCQDLPMGSSWISPPDFKDISAPKNPFDFNYANYMKIQGIRLQLSLKGDELIPTQTNSYAFKYQPAIWQQKLVAVLRTHTVEPTNFELLSALLFGHKSDLSPETKSQFATAGVMHLLAVSGLHVGIVMLFARWVFSLLKRLPRGRFLQTLATVCAVWGFALLTGASPSVLRAATLFSFLTVGKLLGGRGSSINSLFVSAWLLLIVNPYFLFQLGFQLSYLAVFFILWLMPAWSSLLATKRGIGRKWWDLTGLSLIAQWGTAPLSLFYFQRFPSYFLLANWLLLPPMGLLLIWGFITTLLLVIFPELNWLMAPLEWAVTAVRRITQVIEQLPYSSLILQAFQPLTLLTLLISSIWLAHLLKARSKRFLPASAFCLTVVYVLVAIDNYRNSDEKLWVMHQYGRSQLMHSGGDYLSIYQDSLIANDYSIAAAIRNTRVDTVIQNTLPALIKFKGLTVLRVDGSYPLDIKLNTADALLLTDNAKIHLERWINTISPKLIIADGSSYGNVKNRWKQTAIKKKLPFHDTSLKGAFEFE